jgi:hypothetical protein
MCFFHIFVDPFFIFIEVPSPQNTLQIDRLQIKYAFDKVQEYQEREKREKREGNNNNMDMKNQLLC